MIPQYITIRTEAAPQNGCGRKFIIQVVDEDYQPHEYSVADSPFMARVEIDKAEREYRVRATEYTRLFLDTMN